ncbi:hypothetical protein DPMN_167290 [Dreissena polymorpha]|uniref:Uncharacterized protein n=2 Tax=Dreissena polymorpha TaxID=45954 RepID=A0A9D4F3L3_DREPO|nr:hypothetical protein DPMN_167290 [Dreissena polymorpha]
MGKSDMTISLISAICSNFHLVDLPVWKPPVPRVLNTGGSLLDLNPNGNDQTITSLQDAAAKANNETVDPATVAIQKVHVQIRHVLGHYDKHFSHLIFHFHGYTINTLAFANL